MVLLVLALEYVEQLAEHSDISAGARSGRRIVRDLQQERPLWKGDGMAMWKSFYETNKSSF